ncbi:MAG: outer membrane beta-barrel protein, partial [Myxococcota bacterium]
TEGEGSQIENREYRPRVEFDAGVSGNAYIFLEDQAQNNFGVRGNFDLRVNPRGRFGFSLSNRLARTVRPFTGRSNQSIVDSGRVNNATTLLLQARSPGGVFNTSFGYGFRLDFFESEDFRYANSFVHQITADTHYRFLPRTSIFWDATAEFTDYYNDAIGAPLAQSNNWRVRSRVGLNGVITPRLSATVAAGYTAVFLQDSTLGDFDTVLLLASLRGQLTPTLALGLGYERENRGSVTGNYRLQDRGYVDLQWLFARSFLFGAEVSVAYLQFGDIAGASIDPLDPGARNRTDVYLEAKAFAEYRFTDYLAVNLSVGYFGDFTDFEFLIPVDTEPAPVADPAGFSKFEAWLGVRVFY